MEDHPINDHDFSYLAIMRVSALHGVTFKGTLRWKEYGVILDTTCICRGANAGRSYFSRNSC